MLLLFSFRFASLTIYFIQLVYLRSNGENYFGKFTFIFHLFTELKYLLY